MKIELQFEFINLHKEEEPFIEYINSMQAIVIINCAQSAIKILDAN
jgi:hypothetical protein